MLLYNNFLKNNILKVLIFWSSTSNILKTNILEKFTINMLRYQRTNFKF